MCEAIGCFRKPLPTEGECYDKCYEDYGTGLKEGALSEPATESFTPGGGEVSPGTELGFVYEQEPNDQIGDATEIKFGSPVMVKGQITPAGDVDFYKFYVDTSGILQVKLDAVPEDMKARIDLYGKNFNWITRKDASNPGDSITLEKDLSGPGWHYIAILDLDGKAHSEEYSMTGSLKSE
jgi:hypothetical protein